MNKIQSILFQKTTSFILALTMTASIMPSVNVFAEVQAGSSKTYVGDGYSIKYDVTAVYGDHSNVNVTLTNTGDEAIRNWALRYDTDGDIENIWNGVIFESDDLTIIKNNEYNYEVLPEESISFGYTIVGSDKLPENIFLSTKHKDYAANNYTVTLNVENDWGTGFSGNISIEAVADEAIEAWKLDLDTNFVLSTVWNSTIVDSNENSYTIESTYATAFIKPGETKSFGISGTKEIGTPPEISNISLSGIAVDANAEANNISDSSESSETDSSSQADSSSKPDDLNSSSKPDESSKPENDSEIDMADTDKDGLPDFYEKMLGTDIEEPDTDHDGLTDYQEICISGTDPLVFNSVKKDVADAKADIDEDGLSNIAEIGLETNLRDDDTDDDELKDGDEVNIYGTDPLDPDTDKDGLTDSAEVNKFGTDPLDPDSDDNGILDGDEKRLQTFTHEAENKESAVTEVSVTIEATGDLDKTMHIESIMDKDVMCSEVVGLVGEPFSIETTSQFDKATITYKVDQSKLGDTKFDDLLFLWYDRENDNFVELETTHDAENSTVSVETTHFSEYMITDGEAWIKNWQYIASILNPLHEEDKKPIGNVEFTFTSVDSQTNNDPRMIDIVKKIYCGVLYDSAYNFYTIPHNYYSGSVKICYEDYDRYVWKNREGIYDKDAVFEHIEKLMRSVDYAYNASEAEDLGFICSKNIYINEINPYDRFKEDKFNIANVLWASGGGSGNLSEINIAVIKDDYTFEPGDDRKIDKLYYQDNCIYYYNEFIVDLRPDYDYYLASICQKTGGMYIQYNENENDLDTMIKIINFKISNTDLLVDSDEDGFTDIEETNGWLFKSNGVGITTDPENDDTDGDTLKDNEEMETKLTLAHYNSGTPVVKPYHVMKSNPADKDTDHDGLLDSKEKANKWGWCIEDPEPRSYNNFIPFGTQDYFSSLEKHVTNYYDIIDDYDDHPQIEKVYVDTMMAHVNAAEYYNLIPDIYWDKFCEYFNRKVFDTEIYNKDLHYFRIKLNRAPNTLDEFIELNSKLSEEHLWTLLDPDESQYHMYDTSACYDENTNEYKGCFNLKFVSWDGKYEAVYNFKGELLNELNDPVNMGTYNYANPSDKYYHGKLDVAPYSDEFLYDIIYEPKGWCNIPGVKIDFKARSKNLSNYEHSTEAKEYRKRIEEILYG